MQADLAIGSIKVDLEKFKTSNIPSVLKSSNKNTQQWLGLPSFLWSGVAVIFVFFGACDSQLPSPKLETVQVKIIPPKMRYGYDLNQYQVVQKKIRRGIPLELSLKARESIIHRSMKYFRPLKER